MLQSENEDLNPSKPENEQKLVPIHDNYGTNSNYEINPDHFCFEHEAYPSVKNIKLEPGEDAQVSKVIYLQLIP